MFEIQYNGGNSITITTKKGTIVTDPKTSVVGLKDQKVVGLIELATEARFVVGGETKISIEGPGEYGVADFDISGIAAQRHLDTEADPKISTIYRIEIGETRIAVLGNIYEKLNEDQLEAIGVVDILVLPVGGNGYTLDPTAAVVLTRQMTPRVVIPIHYEDRDVKYEVPQLPLEEFTKGLGAPIEETAKYKLKSAGALPEGLTVVHLIRS